MKNAWRVAVAMLFVCFTISEFTFAQSDLGTISGFVKDPSGATVSGAKVTLSNQSGLQRQATTNDSGFYTVTNLPRGLYTLMADAPGLQQYESRYNNLNTAPNLVIDASLAGVSNNQNIEISASAVRLQTDPPPL